jgi:hypothetical protein
VRSATQVPHWSTFHRRTPYVCTMQTFFATRTSTFIGRCTSGIESRMWIQRDGAPPHYGREVTTYLNRKFRGRWIGRGGPVTWPPRSPDLCLSDFFVWSFFKSIVYRRSKPETTEQLVARIQDALEGFRNDFPRFPWEDSMDRRLAACIEVGGCHFENILE